MLSKSYKKHNNAVKYGATCGGRICDAVASFQFQFHFHGSHGSKFSVFTSSPFNSCFRRVLSNFGDILKSGKLEIICRLTRLILCDIIFVFCTVK